MKLIYKNLKKPKKNQKTPKTTPQTTKKKHPKKPLGWVLFKNPGFFQPWEQELRRKAEQDRAELRKRLDDETNRRTKEQNNSHHVAEKISSLEKERNQVSLALMCRSLLLHVILIPDYPSFPITASLEHLHTICTL